MLFRAGFVGVTSLMVWAAIGDGFVNAADAPSAKLALAFKPIQKDVQYETPDAKEFDQCKVEVERGAAGSGWVVMGPSGQVLRRFVDTNGDNVVDQWRYYEHGIEVYRDIDSNFNNKVDQSRWLGTAGTRWGIDSDEDGRLDSWRRLSAEEASREAVQAIVHQDEAALSRILINAEDVETLALEDSIGKKILEEVRSPSEKLRQARSRSLTSQSKWLKFDTTLPSLIPVDHGKASSDLLVYGNSMAIVETSGKTVFLSIGEMVRVGDVWKLTQIPKILDGNVQVADAGILLQPHDALTGTSITANSVSPQIQKLIGELQKLDAAAPNANAGSRAVSDYQRKRAELLGEMRDAATSNEEKSQWTRQLVDGLAAAVQTGGYPAGLEELKSIEAELRRNDANSSDVPYTEYRRLLSEYSVNVQKADEDQRVKLQQKWLADLERFAKEHPQADDASDAMLQLAMSSEFSGEIETAEKWYKDLIRLHPKADATTRARGAVKRLAMEGKPFEFVGDRFGGGKIDARGFRGKVLLVLFWSTWCQPCTEELPQIRELHRKHRREGFEILGVNLDTTSDPVAGFMRKHSVTWPQIYQPGGLDSEPAQSFGIISLPTMFLVDRSGKVVSRNISLDDLKTELPKLLKQR